MLRNVAKALKPNGRIGIVDFKKDGLGPGPPMEERVDPERVIRDAEAAGLRLLSRENFLRYQYMLVFARQMMPVPPFFADYQARVDAELRRLMPAETERVGEAMAYTLLAPSKRVRPVLTLLSRRAVRRRDRPARSVAACAVEMVHASSLILDDLPSMDDARAAARPAGQPRRSTARRSRSSRRSVC